ncbi:hypothetical protein LGM71_19300 [Burkholderia sp. AU33545]|uniref:hypothetical protein n=1 Tax=Burkholderia sp. AU33545 TaxID=2879631 RepID=UPI001CF21856|nr:hypothetical protein [Burkholderia sp. AU33545]MCA8203202.1 hypothetical protein [Burkholderia sp. AU33545]
MTLPASFPLSMSQIATELGLSLPLSINHPWVIALAGKSALPVSFSDLLGKSGRWDGAATAVSLPGGVSIQSINAAFFGGVISYAIFVTFGNANQFEIGFSSPPNYSGNLKIFNNTDSTTSAVLTKTNSTTWDSATGLSNNVIVLGVNKSYTILPST